MGINIGKVDSTLTLEVLVQFANANGNVTEGSYKATFKRPDQEQLGRIVDPDAEVRNIEVLDEYLVGVSGISNGEGELPADEQLAWVKKTPECISAGAAAFLRAFRPVRYEGKTSKR